MPKQSVDRFTSAPELESTSEAEQMYLITVARAGEAGIDGPVPVARIAQALDVSVPSANEMIRKLDGRGLLTYEPYRGVRLSDRGRRIAGQVLRTRRLWATFLAEHLGFPPMDADDQACHLEHATSPEAADRLATFLGDPEVGPLGRPIPSPAQHEPARRHSRLVDVALGIPAEVVSISVADRAAEFLAAEGLVPGARITISAAGSAGLLVEVGDQAVHLQRSLAAHIEVHADVPGGV